MTIADELQAATAASPVQCKICRFLGGLSLSEAAEWRRGIANPSYSHEGVVRVLARYGCVVTVSSVKRHRRNHP